jgi:carnitine O-acetyltransferase
MDTISHSWDRRSVGTLSKVPKVPTFGNQSAIPRLPIPSLQNMADKYLKSLQPLLSQEELAHSTGLVQEFLQGSGQVLQGRLEEYDKTQEVSIGEIALK